MIPPKPRQARGRGACRGWGVVSRVLGVAGVVGLLTASGTALGAPFEGAGTGERVAGAAVSRTSAFEEARKAALEQAIEQAAAEVSVQAEQLQQARADWANWTGAYRVASVDYTATQVLARLEVDVDVARLKKFLAVTPGVGTDGTLRWGGVSMSGCGSVTTPTEIHRLLAASGLVREVHEEDREGRALKLVVACSDTGDVAFTYLRGAKVRVMATVDEVALPQAVGVGLGATRVEATTMAIQEGLERLKLTLNDRPAGFVRLVLRGDWQAEQSEAFARRIRDAVRGVAGVRVLEFTPSGSVVWAVETAAPARAVLDAMRELEYVRSRSMKLQVNSEGGIDAYVTTTGTN